MAYEIPQQLEYKEKIVFGLTFRQLAYLFIFAPLASFIAFKTHWFIVLKIFLCTNIGALAVGFIYLDLEKHVRNWIVWYRSKQLGKPEQFVRFIPVESIKDNLILMKDKRKLAILKITPLNFAIKPEEAKNAITLGFQKFLNSLDFPVQIVMNTDNLDLKDYFTGLEKRMPPEQFRELFVHYKEHVNAITKQNNILNRTFYLVIPEKTDIGMQVEICQGKLNALGLKNARLHNEELRSLLIQFFEATQAFFPHAIKQFPSYVMVNKTFNRTIYAHGYPRSVETGFLDKIVSTFGNFDLSLHIEPYDIETMMIFLNKELQKQRSDLYASKLKNMLNPSLEIKYKDTKAILENLQKGKDKLFNVSLYINCRASTKEALDLLTKRVEAELNALLIIPKTPYFRMLQGFQSCSPLTINALKQSRNVPTAALSAFFPFTSSFLQADKSGVWLGLNKNSIPIIKDIFTFSNPNGLCLASSGSGKSYMAKLLISRYLLNGTKVMVIDPQGEYKALVKRFNGQLIDLSRTSETIINPLDLMGHDYPEKRLALMDLMPIMLGDLSDPQRAIIDRALTTTYEERGIYMDKVSTWSKKPPILEDLLNVLKKAEKKTSLAERPTIRSLISRLDTYVHGVFSFLNQETNLDLSNQFICFDIGALPKQVKPITMFLVLDYIYTTMKRDLSRKLLVIDEAWSLLRQAHDASYIFEIVKTCRKFNLALFLINQEVEGMLDSDAGKSVLANSAYTLLMRQKPAAINGVKRTFFLSDSEVTHLLTAAPGEGILLMDDEHSEIRIVASKDEHAIITTNADEISASQEQETNVQRLNRIQEQINNQIRKRSDRPNPEIKITKDENCVKYADLSRLEIEYLKSHNYISYWFTGILSNKKERYMIRQRKSESPQHMLLVHDIASYLRKITNDVHTYQTVKPDIVFKLHGAEYAIEVETGKMLKFKKQALKDKIESLEKTYPERWFFVVTDKNLTRHYNVLGKTYDKRSVAAAIARIASKK